MVASYEQMPWITLSHGNSILWKLIISDFLLGTERMS